MVAALNSQPNPTCVEKPQPGRQVAQQLKLENSCTVRYYVYLPEDYSPEKTFPLMLFLHGRGERGDKPEELQRVLSHGPPKLIAQGKHFPCIVISPQQTTDNQWWTISNLLAFLEKVEKEYPVDSSRIYCTGLSMGGFATWSLGAELPSHFAALAPICGGGEIEWAGNLSQTPTWAFHGTKDDVIPVQRSEEMVEAIRNQNAEIKLTLYPEADHDSWTQTYNNPDLYQWIFSHQK